MRRIVSVWLPRWPIDRLNRHARRHRQPGWVSAQPEKQPVSPTPSRAPYSAPHSAFEQATGEPVSAVREPDLFAAPNPAGPQDWGADLPFALTLPLKGGPRLVAVNQPALDAGLAAGQLLSDARPLCPGLRVAQADPAADRGGLQRLSDWCGRYTPWTAPWSWHRDDARFQKGDPLLGPALTPDEAGLFLDVTGCAHLFGGEPALLADLKARFAGFGIEARAALADTPGAAWALSRYGVGGTIVAPGGQGAVLQDLPVAALRLAPETIRLLTGLGLRTIGALAHLPRAPLAARFGAGLLVRLDQAWGRAQEPISPSVPFVPYRVRLVLAEPISEQSHVTHGLERLARDLAQSLAQEGKGARRFILSLYQVDGHVQHLDVGAARPVCEAGHMARLFGEVIARLGGALDAGFGIDVLVLSGLEVEEIAPDQYAFTDALDMPADDTDLPGLDEQEEDRFDPDISALMDRLGNRLGLARVRVFEPVDSHVPERSVMAVPVGESARARKGRRVPSSWSDEVGAEGAGSHGTGSHGTGSHGIGVGGIDGFGAERPLALLPCAEPVDVVAGVPEGPPRLFRWRSAQFQVVRSEGPERIAPEWWRSEDAQARSRDYYRVEDTDGRRFWLYRHGLYGRETSEPKWYLHGIFA